MVQGFPLDWQFFLQAAIAISAFTYVYYTWHTKIPLVVTKAATRDAILDVLEKDIQARPGKNIKIYDLGSGLGGLCIDVARRFPAAQVIGLEMAWPALIYSRFQKRLSGRKNVKFLYRDFWKYDVRDGDIVLFYLGDVVMADMGEKLRREARPGRLIVSNTFPLPADWVADEHIQIPGTFSKGIYIYRQKA